MEHIRKTKNYTLIAGDLMARGLFIISDEKNNTSFWFDSDAKDDLMKLSDKEFDDVAKKSIEFANEELEELAGKLGVDKLNSKN